MDHEADSRPTKNLPQGRLLGLLFLALLGAACASVPPGNLSPPLSVPPQSPADILRDASDLKARAQALYQTRDIVAISYAVFQEEGLLVADTVGWRDLEKTKATKPDTLFQACSLTKVVTAYAILILNDRGLVDLDRDADRYLSRPFLGSPHPEVTVRMLLQHTSGLRNDISGKDKTLHFAPGTQFHYSGLGYQWLQRIIEEVSGLTYGDFVRTNLFVPLGMTRSALTETDPRFQGEIQETRMKWGPLSFRPPFVISREDGAFSLLTSAADFATLVRELRKPTLVRPETAAQMTDAPIPVLPGASWGLGIGVHSDPSGDRLWHDGFNFLGASSALALMDLGPPGLGMVVLAAGPDAPSVLTDLVQTALGGTMEPYWAGIPKD